jgi:hypothetical protein
MLTATFAADLIVLLHFVFILFVSAGGLLALRWPRLAWLHLPCVAWGVLIEITGGICPLTPLEIRFRLAGGDPGYRGDFIDRYLLPVIYPSGLSRGLQISLGIALLLFNFTIYLYAWYRQKKTLTRKRGDTETRREYPF